MVTRKSGVFTFAFITDLHVQPGEQAERVRRCIRSVNSMQGCDFAISGGDLIEDGLGTDYETVHECYNLAQSILTDLKIPVFIDEPERAVRAFACLLQYYGLSEKEG